MNSENITNCKLRTLLEKENLTESEYVHILVLIRKMLEVLKDENPDDYSNYDHLKLFSDWSLHMVIDRSQAGSFLIAIVNINDILNDKKQSNNDELIASISTVIVGQLKDQMRDFLEDNTLPLDLIDEDNKWKNLLSNILEIITQQPVIIKPKHEEKVSENALKEGMWATEVSIEKVNMDGGKRFFVL